MSDFELDLRTVEREIDDATDASGRVVLGVLDGTTAPTEWARLVREGAVLVLAVEGDLNELASGFARDVRDEGGQLVHFRRFLVVTPEGVSIDTDRLG
ncbi:DUF5779 family protein [Halomarina halobia]|uniref:DUF5779 family protein n=1 Tax=Halomarina halobia TaxID=3033386 RepID=A0ABD6A5E9_9EURY|nr:DUF5779 family protein [Halomarina sp. PSR21]